MKNKILWLLMLLITVFGCNADQPAAVFDPDNTGSPTPVVRAIEPARAAFAGVQQLLIKGENFSPDRQRNIVSVNGEVTATLSASGNEMTVVAPLVIGDSLTIRVDVRGAYEPGLFAPYDLKPPFNTFYKFSAEETVLDIAFDNAGNLYALVVAGSDRSIVRFSPDGATRETYARVTVPVGPPSLKMAPGGALMLARKNNRKLYRIPPGGGSTELFVQLPKKVINFDFDSDGALYAGGKGHKLYKVLPDASFQEVADYGDIVIVAVRVVAGYVYLAGFVSEQTPSGVVLQQNIWRHAITVDGVGERLPVLDWTAEIGDAVITSLTLSADGELFIGNDGDDPIFVLRRNGAVAPFLAGLLPGPVIMCSWGDGDFLYYINHLISPPETKIVQLYVGKGGAPYAGRN